MKKALLAVAVISIFLTLAVNAQAAKMVQIKGSDTLINLVQKLSETYMEANPGKFIAVTGGGSGTGIAALINNKCDIANSSRTMKEKEIEQANERGVNPSRLVIAIDGLSVIVNKSNVVDKLTVDQIGKIFRGEIVNWSEVGGSDLKINLYGRQSNSGTFEFLKDVILKGDYSQSMNQMNGNSQIIDAVKADTSAIGYVGVGYVKESTGIVALNVALHEGGEYVSSLNSADVKTGRYPIFRPLNQYIGENPAPAVREFIRYELSAQGQQMVEEMGFFPISDEYKELNKKAGF